MATLEERKAALEKEFNALNDEKDKLIEQGKGLNQRLSGIQARQLELRGALQEAEYLLKDKKEEKSKLVK